MIDRLDQERIKERVRDASDIVEVVEQCVPLRKAGSSFKACCPFHEEKTPSFNVNPTKQIWHCFGCGVGGDVFAFVMQYHGMSFPEALRYLAGRAGIALPEGRSGGDGIGRDAIFHVNRRYAEFYQDLLLRQETGREAREYLQGRGIHAEIAKAFGLGFAPDSWTGACDASAFRDLDRAHLRAAGLAKPRQDGSLYDIFRNRIIFPIHGPGGDIVAFGGRTLGDDDAKYINSPETVVYRKGSQLYHLHAARRAIQQAGHAILVEGYFDAIRLAVGGFEHTVATCGTALTPQQAKVLKRHTDRVVVVYDGDAAGRAAAEKAAGLLLEAELDVGLVTVPAGQDPDDFLREHGAEALTRLLEAAGDVIEFVLEDAAGTGPLNIEQRVAYADRLTAVAQRIPHPVRRRLYLEKIARRLDLERHDLRLPAGAPAAATAAPGPVSEPRVQLREREREPLRIALQHLERPDGLVDVAGALGAYPPIVQRLLRRIVDADPAFGSLQAVLDATEDPTERQVLLELEVTGADRQCYPPEWLLHHMNLQRAQRRLRELPVELREARAHGNDTTAAALLAEVQEMTALKEASRTALHSLEVEHVAA